MKQVPEITKERNTMKIDYKSKPALSALLVFLLTLSSAIIIGLKFVQPAKNMGSVAGAQTSAADKSLPTFTVDQLKEFDGSDPEKPIYLALDGAVYDVTAGKEYYQTDGSYHYLAGKDSSKELHLVGGNIIKEKYPVIGYLKSE